jgi:hypothetical protein
MSKPQQQRHVFVLDVADGKSLAFEAENAAAAEALLQAPWFERAVREFRRAKGCRTSDIDGLPVHARTATPAEVSLYWDRAAEFAEESGPLLLARIGEP